MHRGGVAFARAKMASGTAHSPSPEIRPAAAGTWTQHVLICNMALVTSIALTKFEQGPPGRV